MYDHRGAGNGPYEQSSYLIYYFYEFHALIPGRFKEQLGIYWLGWLVKVKGPALRHLRCEWVVFLQMLFLFIVRAVLLNLASLMNFITEIFHNLKKSPLNEARTFSISRGASRLV